MSGYTRQSLADIQDGQEVVAGPLNDEFDALADAFDSTSGHVHDGTAGDAPKISLTGSVAGTLPIANGGTASTTASAARTALGLAIGTDVQAYDSDLASMAALGTIGSQMLYTTSAHTWAETTITSYGRSFVGSANASTARTALGLGTSATIDTGTSGTKIPLLDGSNTWSNTQTFQQAITFSLSSIWLGSPNQINFTGIGGNDFLYFDDATNTWQFWADSNIGSSILQTGVVDASSGVRSTSSFSVSGTTDGYIISAAGSGIVRASNVVLTVGRTTTTGAAVNFRYDGTICGSISVAVGATTYNTSSDQRLKHDFQPIDPTLIDQINVYDFAWNYDNSRAYGVKAQELNLVVPNAVFKGDDPENDMWGVDYSKLVPIMIAKIHDLEARLAALEGA